MTGHVPKDITCRLGPDRTQQPSRIGTRVEHAIFIGDQPTAGHDGSLCAQGK